MVDYQGRLPSAHCRDPAWAGEVVEGNDGLNSCFTAGDAQAAVIFERRLRELAGFRLDPRPLEREAVGIEARRFDQREVFTPTVPTVASIAGFLLEVSIRDMLHHPIVAVDVVPLNLMRGGRHAPQKFALCRGWTGDGGDRSGDSGACQKGLAPGDDHAMGSSASALPA